MRDAENASLTDERRASKRRPMMYTVAEWMERIFLSVKLARSK
eukprot:SAG31_NODE_166_length_21670_cov_22.507719_10_plen_43_part_00